MPPVDPPVEKPTSTDTVPTQGPAQAQTKPPLKERLKVLMTEYGFLAVLVYLSTSVVSITVFTVLIQTADLKALGDRFGVQLEGTSGLLGTLGAAWVLTKLIQVPRIFATLALTPLIGRIPFVARQLKRLE
ncbi:FAM210A/B-like domain-containing protein [Hyalangium minutum]|uniref:FAM210A/B-like domain-containing protein n=1 Tax=Hyalangium minutum TaxID=394096 RepID=UPI0005C47AD8|nr:DUF1279 domain-containing protein [Hyalangium minutum]